MNKNDFRRLNITDRMEYKRLEDAIIKAKTSQEKIEAMNKMAVFKHFRGLK